MKLEDQVCSLELGRRIRDLGIKQESLWWWRWQDDGSVSGWFVKPCTFFPLKEGECSAFTVAELGAMLPEAFLWDGTTQVGVSCAKYSGGWHVRYQSVKFRGVRSVNHFEDGKTEADARAKMLIYLLENHLISNE